MAKAGFMTERSGLIMKKAVEQHAVIRKQPREGVIIQSSGSHICEKTAHICSHISSFPLVILVVIHGTGHRKLTMGYAKNYCLTCSVKYL